MYRRILITSALLTLAILCTFIYFLGRQLMYEKQAELHYNKSEYDAAAERYLRALEMSGIVGRARYLYMIGLCYKNEKDCDHAMDFFIQVIKEYPGSEWADLAQAEVQSCLHEPGAPPAGELLRAVSPLGKAYEQMRIQYKRLQAALRDNKSGTSVELEAEYEAYKKIWTDFERKKTEAWAEVRSGKRVPKLGTGDDRAPTEGAMP